MAETLTRALAKIFGPSILQSLEPDRLGADLVTPVTPEVEEPDLAPATGVPTATPAAGGSAGALIAEMVAHFNAADKALAAKDFAAYGEAMKKARTALERLERLGIKK